METPEIRSALKISGYVTYFDFDATVPGPAEGWFPGIGFQKEGFPNTLDSL